MKNLPDPVAVLREYWGYPSFRPLQEEIVRSVASRKDTLALLPTGGGKSICFQVPGLMLGGLTLVISPLIALMQDQVRNLNSFGIAATYINSTLNFREIDRKLQMAMDGKYKFLYLAPERIQSDIFQARLSKLNIRLIAVDEAHCISQWGYDFRPAYLKINALREELPEVPIIALTASAPPKVAADIREKLELRSPNTFQKSFRRSNLRYRIAAAEDIPGRILRFLQKNPGSGIIYARTRKRTMRMAEMLQKEGISAAAYHGGLNPSQRSQIQNAWIKNETRVIAATNAFGMGIDKPDVRFVIHYNLPADIESYYQEAGRGGRDGAPAFALAFNNPPDLSELERWVSQKYPNWDALCRYYEIACNYFGIPNTNAPDKVFPLDLGTISKTFKVNPLLFYNALQILSREGQLILQEKPEDYAYLRVKVRPHDVIVFKNAHPKLAWLLDLALRQLGGEAFSESLRFLPAYWARLAEVEENALVKGLQFIAARDLIDLRLPSSHPQLRFLQPRHQLSRTELNWSKYAALQKRAQERLEEIKNYVQVPAKSCRAITLEAYFGERGGTDCGKCDYCLGKAQGKRGLRESMEAEIKSLLQSGSLDYWDLVEGMQQGTEQQRRDLIRFLLDKNILTLIGTRKLKWKS